MGLARTVIGTLALCSVAPSAHAQSLWTVDPGGSGDFTSLQLAIQGVSAGDVLLLEPGNHGTAVLDRDLRILGRKSDALAQRPVIAELDVQGITSFTLSAVQVNRLRIEDVSTRSEVDDCRLDGGLSWPSSWSAVHVSEASDLVFARCEVVANSSGPDGRDGMDIAMGSTVQIVGCDLRGSDAFSSDFFGLSGIGGNALRVRGTSRVWMVGTSAQGGEGQDYFDFLGAFEYGRGGDGVRALEGSVVDLRGGPMHTVAGGNQNPGRSGFFDGLSLRCSGVGVNASILVDGGGVNLVSGINGACTSFQSLALPRLVLSGSGAPSTTVSAHVTADVQGSGGVVVALLGSVSPNLWELPGILESTPLFLEPSTILYQWVGFGAAPSGSVEFALPLPPSAALTGARVHLQAFTAAPSGQALGSNAEVLVLSY